MLKSSFKDGRLEVGKLRGGKLDDITVVVAMVCEREEPPAPAQDPEPAAAA